MQLRDASARDLPRILEIERLAFPSPWSLRSFERELTLPFSRLMVANVPEVEHPVGFLCRWIVADECHVLNVAVHPEFRRRGIGLSLMLNTIEEARDRRAASVTLEVRRSNMAARQMYRKLGFDERRMRRNYYGPGEDAIVMELEIGKPEV